jgi:hypothetical protein
MGETRGYICPSCRYAADVSGGDDAGMAVVTTTIACGECRALRDVVTGRREQGFAPIAPVCPRGRRHHVSPWRFPGPCPRCGTTMVEDPDAAIALWD